MELYLIRHTTPDIEKGICYGQTDIPLSNKYNKELEKITEQLPVDSIAKIYSSPLRRCTILANDLNKIISLDDRLKELDFGSWEMKPWDQIPKEEIDPWMKNFVSAKVPNGESYQELQQRIVNFYKSLDHSSDEVVLVIAHAGPIRALLAYIRGIPLEDSFQIKINYGDVIKI